VNLGASSPIFIDSISEFPKPSAHKASTPVLCNDGNFLLSDRDLLGILFEIEASRLFRRGQVKFQQLCSEVQDF
jgi:hypothetical protein